MEETGYRIEQVEKLFEAYMSPGSVTEKVRFFAAEYAPSQRLARGGGVEDKDIEVIELSFTDALAMIKDRRICDGKTIM